MHINTILIIKQFKYVIPQSKKPVFFWVDIKAFGIFGLNISIIKQFYTNNKWRFLTYMGSFVRMISKMEVFGIQLDFFIFLNFL